MAIAHSGKLCAIGRAGPQRAHAVRYRRAAPPFPDYLMVSPPEMSELASLGRWQLVRTRGDKPYYVGILTKV